MGNFDVTKSEIKNYIRARTPLIIINSSERERVERMLKEIVAELGCPISYYTDTKQVCSLGGGQTLNIDSDPLQYITSAFKKNRGVTFAFGDVRRVGDDNIYSRDVLNILYLAKESNNTLILITSDNVWPRLAQFGMLTTLGYPDIDERVAQIEAFISMYKGRFAVEWTPDDVRRAATLLRGFSEIQIENILSAGIISNGSLRKSHLRDLTAQKSRLYGAVSGIQPVRVSASVEVSGLGALKAWLEEKRKIFFAPDEALKSRDLDTPKGILLAGVPGCGKSFSAKMIAKQWELPLFRFDIGAIYDKWVGESEKKMREALEFIDNVSPCVVWVDEIEKALSISDSGNDTGKRVLGQFLFWLQESQNRAFLVATANDISALPFELFRKGRFSEVFFIDLPAPEEREAVIRQYAEKSLHTEIGESDMAELVRLTEGFSYSDIEYAIKDVAQMALTFGQSVINQSLLAGKLREIVPISRSNPEMIERVREWGRQRAVPASDTKGMKQ